MKKSEVASCVRRAVCRFLGRRVSDLGFSRGSGGSEGGVGTGRGRVLSEGCEVKEIGPGGNAGAVGVGPEHSRKQIWCATIGNGLMKVALDEQSGAVVSRLDVEQGLPSQRVF